MFPRIVVIIELFNKNYVVTIYRLTGPGGYRILATGDSFPSFAEAKAFGYQLAEERGYEDDPIHIACDAEIADPENPTRH
jgi:hypothetical protein